MELNDKLGQLQSAFLSACKGAPVRASQLEPGHLSDEKVSFLVIRSSFPFCSHNIYVLGLLFFVPANATAE